MVDIDDFKFTKERNAELKEIVTPEIALKLFNQMTSFHNEFQLSFLNILKKYPFVEPKFVIGCIEELKIHVESQDRIAQLKWMMEYAKDMKGGSNGKSKGEHN